MRIDRRRFLTISAAVAAGEGGGQLPQALDELIECVTRHFAHEEAILADGDHPVTAARPAGRSGTTRGLKA